MVEAMADGLRAALDAGDFDRHELVAEQGDDALQRAHPAQALGRERRRAPAHRLGPGEGMDDMADRAGEHRARDHAGPLDHREQHLPAFAVVTRDELLASQAGRAEETLRAPASGASARGPLRSSVIVAVVPGDAADDQREAARGGVALDAPRRRG
jgi:hypothetical protein